MNKANLNIYIYITTCFYLCVSHLRVIRTMKAIRHMPSVGAAPHPLLEILSREKQQPKPRFYQKLENLIFQYYFH